jgi:hypothetical protein
VERKQNQKRGFGERPALDVVPQKPPLYLLRLLYYISKRNNVKVFFDKASS